MSIAHTSSFLDVLRSDKYRHAASKMIAAGSTSFVIDFIDILSQNSELALSLINNPDETLQHLSSAVYELVSVENPNYASQVQKDLRVRIRAYEPSRVSMRELGKKWLNKLVFVSGTIIRATNEKARMVSAAYTCPNGHINVVDLRLQGGADADEIKRPTRCASCEETRFELDTRKSEFVDYQIMRLQEPPEELPPGQIPAYYDVTFSEDLVNSVRPGDRVLISAILRAVPNQARKSSVYEYRLECNYAETIGKEPDILVTEEDVKKLQEIASSPDAYSRLIASVAPTVLGHEREKEAVLLLLAGAPGFKMKNGPRLRGDINVLLVGDPGVSKSMLLKSAAGVSPRAVYSSGKGSSAAGLSAAVVKDRDSYSLEIGAAVLADEGVLLIDEFDKMRPEDRSAMHEIAEQGTVTISKAGINAVLNARVSILAAMNPINGVYNEQMSFSENVPPSLVPPALLSRFDLIFVMKDRPEEEQDRKLVRHVSSLRDSGEYPIPPPVDPATLRKYLNYCKKFMPRMREEAKKILEDFYIALRKVSAAEGGIGATPRTLESLIRLAQARARVLLRNEVTEEDAKVAVRLMQEMFSTVLVDPKSGKRYDFGQIEGRPSREMSNYEVVMKTIKELTQEKGMFTKKEFVEALTKTGKFTEEEAEKEFQKCFRAGLIYEFKPGSFRLTGS